MGHGLFDWELSNLGHREAMEGWDLIFGLQNSHTMNLWVRFQVLWEWGGGMLSSMTQSDLQI